MTRAEMQWLRYCTSSRATNRPEHFLRWSRIRFFSMFDHQSRDCYRSQYAGLFQTELRNVWKRFAAAISWAGSALSIASGQHVLGGCAKTLRFNNQINL